MRMDNLVLAVTITIGLILAGTHTTSAQCEYCSRNTTACFLHTQTQVSLA